MEKQHLEMLQLLESIEVMLQNGDSIHPDSVIRGAIQTVIGMDINLNNKKQTAVEWLQHEIKAEVTRFLDGEIDKMILLSFMCIAKEKAKELEKQQAHEYAEFAIRCDRKEMKILNFDGFINLE